MHSPSAIILLCSLYAALIFAVALWVERKAAAGIDIANKALIYALSLSVYQTAWTYYGSVANSASNGMLFLAFYLGPTLAVSLWWIVLRKLVRVKNSYLITSIADFISLRYDKSTAIAAMVTMIGILALFPCYAVEFRAVVSTFGVVTGTSGSPRNDAAIGLAFAAFCILFTIVVGVRRLVPAERHQGAIVAMTAGSVVKLAAFLAAGIYVTYGFFNGFGDLFGRFALTPSGAALGQAQDSASFYISWTTFLLLSMTTVLFLPWQFHLAVVENFQESHIGTAMWLVPLYMLLFSLFVLPVAMAGLLSGLPLQRGSAFALLLPLASGQSLLAPLLFLGGFCAATGMVTISSMTVSTMACNHLLLPVIDSFPRLSFLKRHLLQCRRGGVALLVLAGYWFAGVVGQYPGLLDVGVVASVAILQIAPAMLGALFWRRGNSKGALLGMASGLLLWAYTLVVPAFARGGFLTAALLERGPWGISALRPEHLLGVDGLDPVSHAVLWTLLFNAGFYVLASVYTPQEEEEQSVAVEIVSALAAAPLPERLPGEETIDLAAKKNRIEELYREYFTPGTAAAMIEQCLAMLHIHGKEKISIAELAEFYREAEKRLAGSIGAASAHKALFGSGIIPAAEEEKLKSVYADIIAELKLPPAELKTKIDYHREREKLLALQAAELEEKIRERDQEIAERRKAEEALRNSESGLADIIDFLPDATFAVDAEGRIIVWNRAAEEFTGVRAEDMLGKGNHEYAVPFYGKRRPVLLDLVLHGYQDDEIRRLYPRVEIKNGIVIGESPTRNVKRGEAYTLGMAAPLYDSDGKLVGVIESVRDMTERREADEELKKHRANLEELVKARTAELMLAKDRAEVASQAKTSFLSSMSHELRTPLNAILGYAQILKRQRNLTEQQRQQIEIIRGSGEHLLALINDILDMGKIEAQKMELDQAFFELSPLLRQVFNIAKVKAEEKELGFRYEESTPLPQWVRGDQRKVKQILLNLLSNAVKYTRQGSVRTQVGYNRDGGTLVCEVSDTGVGIAADQLDRIFEPFTQLAGTGVVREGAGLGLAITKRLVDLMQGKVTVESELGEGTTFRVELPLPALPHREMRRERKLPAVTGYRGTRKKVLVADDNKTNSSLLFSLLQPLGFSVTVAQDGAEAVRRAVEQRPDLVILDLVMPEMDGVEAGRRIRKIEGLEAVKIIGTSATVTDTEQKEAFQAVCDDFVTKPIGIDLILEKIAEMLGIAWVTAPGEPERDLSAAPAAGGDTFETPPQDQLKELHELAVRGDMQGVRAWADSLKEKKPGYGTFAGVLKELAVRFKAKSILELVERLMTQKQ